eukprot:7922430-Pyramimonas_sp.AAC.1
MTPQTAKRPNFPRRNGTKHAQDSPTTTQDQPKKVPAMGRAPRPSSGNIVSSESPEDHPKPARAAPNITPQRQRKNHATQRPYRAT